MDQVAAFLERFVFDIHRFQDNDNDKYGGNKRMQQTDTRLSVQSLRRQISADHQSQRKYFRLCQVIHFLPSPFLTFAG